MNNIQANQIWVHLNSFWRYGQLMINVHKLHNTALHGYNECIFIEFVFILGLHILFVL